MALPRLDGKHLLIFAGKGGVGKTTCSAATALHYAAHGKRTLLVTVDPAKRLEDCLGVALVSAEREVRPNLWASMLDPEEIIRAKLEQYAEGARVMEHPLFKYVTNYLPGLNELMAIGRLNDIRNERNYDVIVIDTAPTGHALSFLSAPKAIQELMSEKSLIRWALRGYTVWQRVQKASRGLRGILGGRKDKAAEDEEGETGKTPSGKPPAKKLADAAKEAEDVDLEAVFKSLAAEAKEIQDMLTDPERTALNIVTLPEKLPIEETIDLHEHAVKEIGIHVEYIIINKMQPDALGPHEGAFFKLLKDKKARATLTDAMKKAGHPPGLVASLLSATEFSDLRRRMNLLYANELATRLPKSHRILLPLFKEDIVGLERLDTFGAALFGAGLEETTAAR